MKKLLFTLTMLLFFLANAYSQKGFKAQKVTLYNWNRGGEQWTYLEQVQYKFNSRGDTTEIILKNQSGYLSNKHVREFNNRNLLEKISKYAYDVSKASWLLVGLSKYTYNTDHKIVLLEELYLTNNGKDTTDNLKYISNYDVIGRQTEFYVERKYNGQWNKWHGFKNSYTDSAGLTNLVLVKTWNSNLNDFTDREKKVYYYDANKNLIKEEQFYWIIKNGFGGWELNYATKYQYGADGKYYEMSHYNLTSEFLKKKNIAWHDWDKKQMSGYEQQSWNANTQDWASPNRFKISYPAENSITTIVEDYNNGWVENSRTTRTKVTAEFESVLIERKDTSGWRIQFSRQYTENFDVYGRLTEIVMTEWNTQLKVMENSSKRVYEDFTEVVGMKDESIFTDVNIYPNPVKDNLQLEISANENFEAKVVLTDISAKVVSFSNEVIYQGKNHININTSQLKPGLYLLRMETTSGKTYSHKIIKTE